MTERKDERVEAARGLGEEDGELGDLGGDEVEAAAGGDEEDQGVGRPRDEPDQHARHRDLAHAHLRARVRVVLRKEGGRAVSRFSGTREKVKRKIIKNSLTPLDLRLSTFIFLACSFRARSWVTTALTMW